MTHFSIIAVAGLVIASSIVLVPGTLMLDQTIQFSWLVLGCLVVDAVIVLFVAALVAGHYLKLEFDRISEDNFSRIQGNLLSSINPIED